jgi:hypothetical protein
MYYGVATMGMFVLCVCVCVFVCVNNQQGVVYDVCARVPPHPSLFNACVTATQCAVAALTDASAAQAAAEHRETALLLVV